MAAYLLLICAAFAGGVINSVAGGGSFLTFPALVFSGVPSIVANASSTMALLPGAMASAWAYRDDFRKPGRLPFIPMLVASLIGGTAGALLLLGTSQATFDSLIPWLMLAAALLFTFGPRIAPILNRSFHIGPATVIFVQLLVGIFGSYFGGTIGIVMLAAWSSFGITDIHYMNANKTVLAASRGAVTVVLFIVAGKVLWPQALAMLGAAVTGGYMGARWAKKIDPKYLRAVIIVISFSMTVAFFLRHK